MHHVEAHVARSAGAKHRVQVCTVVVHQSAGFVYELLDSRYLLLKEAEGVGVGHHHGGSLRSMLCKELLKRLHVDGAVLQGLHLYDVQSAYGSAGWVGAVGTIGHNDQTSGIVAATLVVALDDHQTRQLTMGTSEGLQSESMETRKLAERAAEHGADCLRPLNGIGWL